MVGDVCLTGGNGGCQSHVTVPFPLLYKWKEQEQHGNQYFDGMTEIDRAPINKMAMHDREINRLFFNLNTKKRTDRTNTALENMYTYLPSVL